MEDNVTNRRSLTVSLVEYYRKNRAGGAFNVHDSVITSGTNALSTGDSISDAQYTKVKGFKIKQGLGESEFQEVNDGVNSLETSIYMKGFDNTKYFN